MGNAWSNSSGMSPASIDILLAGRLPNDIVKAEVIILGLPAPACGLCQAQRCGGVLLDGPCPKGNFTPLVVQHGTVVAWHGVAADMHHDAWQV